MDILDRIRISQPQITLSIFTEIRAGQHRHIGLFEQISGHFRRGYSEGLDIGEDVKCALRALAGDPWDGV